MGDRRHMALTVLAALAFIVHTTNKPFECFSGCHMRLIYCPVLRLLGHLLIASLSEEPTRNGLRSRVPTAARVTVGIHRNQLHLHYP